MGRPASAPPGIPAKPRGERLEARISADQKGLFQRAAELQGRSLTDFVVQSAQDAALRTIAEMGTIRLSEAESRAFAEALLTPAEPHPRLREAARRFVAAMGR